ncbi:hypothetical protein HN873_046413, partial [Arachis hypogaea]
HNSRGCDKKEEAMASRGAAAEVNVDVVNSVNLSEEPMAVRPPPLRSSTAHGPPKPIMKPTMAK